jgi:DNA primase
VEEVDLEWFDIEEYLDSRGIAYDLDGKNVQSGWIGMQCLWCDDHSNHLGIDLDTKGINCWRCPAKGTVIKLIMTIDRCSLPNALRTVEKFSYSRVYSDKKPTHISQMTARPVHVQLPVVAKNQLDDAHRKFLIRRKFDPDFIFQEYRLLSNGPIGDYALRLIIPFYQRRRLVTFTTRDITDKAKIPYVHCPKKLSIYHPKDTLYNLDKAEDEVIVVEGVTDVWRIGNGAVATCGDKWTAKQAKLLSKFKRVFVLFDTEEEAQQNALSLANDVSAFVNEVEVLEFGSTDPADLSEADVKHLRNSIFGKIY